ncbi:zf-HC2 domain-containing protein [Kribbella sp. NBC_01245]|uniref:hypothetical protein n=1 Tax=Kribbella sp. NBC_01245 TaxID=2903578 RepID=UPI002E2D0DBC|nr:hypothetical protein [Kribbella sp. NBC_01245]
MGIVDELAAQRDGVRASQGSDTNRASSVLNRGYSGSLEDVQFFNGTGTDWGGGWFCLQNRSYVVDLRGVWFSSGINANNEISSHRWRDACPPTSSPRSSPDSRRLSRTRRRQPRSPGESTCRARSSTGSSPRSALDDVLPPDWRTGFEHHLDECDGCTEYVEQIRLTLQALGATRSSGS